MSKTALIGFEFSEQEQAQSIAACQHRAEKDPGEHGFFRQFISDYEVDPDDATMLDQHIQREVDRIVGEKFLRLIDFFEKCRIPKALVFATLVTEGDMKMTDIAAQCGVSKQAVHKQFRAMEPAFKPYGEGFQRRRQFQLQKPNEKRSEENSRD